MSDRKPASDPHSKTTFKQKAKSGSKKAWHQIKKTASESATVASERLFNRSLVIGVTGFSRSGKSTFITSLIYQLLHFDNAALSAFGPALKGQLLSAVLKAPDDTQWASFNYQSGVHALNGKPPNWPQPTRGFSSAILEIRYQRRKNFINRKRIGTVQIELRDYPGEWLLDLPMLRQNFAQWSTEQFDLLAEPLRESLQEQLREDLEVIDPLSAFDPALFEQLYPRFQQYLRRCKQNHLVVNQPGRALLDDEQHLQTWLPFVPLQGLVTLDKGHSYPEGSWAAELNRRYENYLTAVVQPFYRSVFAGIERQIVLVDVLNALSQGEDCFNDTRRGLATVMESFRIGRNSWFSHLFRPRIEHLLIAASKIDQVLPEQHENIRELLGKLVASAYRTARHEGIECQCEAFASVRSTTLSDYHGHAMLKGLYGDGIAGLQRHPTIPQQLPKQEEWQQYEGWQLRELLPPTGLQLDEGGPLPHIRLDSVIRELIGDQFK